MAFSTDYSGVSDNNGILPPGEYEAVIKYAGEDITKASNKIYINVTMVIRNDVEQPCRNKRVWYPLYQRLEPSKADMGCGGYSFKQIQSLSKAAGLPNGKTYESIADWCAELANKPVRITVEHEEFNGKTQARVKWVNASRKLPCTHVWPKKDDNAEPATVPGFYPVDETLDADDLPF